MLGSLHSYKEKQTINALDKIKSAAINQENIFNELMEASKHCSLGQISNALFEVGGQYRRNM